MKIPVLYAMHYSPWSHRAQWALEHHNIDFQYREHVPLLGELTLRRRARHARTQGHSTVPLLITPDGALTDSWEIMCYADRNGTGSPLQTDKSEVAGWVKRLEPAYNAARRRVTRDTLKSKAALSEAAGAVVPRALAGLSRPVAALGARFIAHKYQLDTQGSDLQEALIEGLEDIREALGDGPYLYDTLSAADIIAASLITAIQPHSALPLGPATRAIWADEGLSERFSELITWRDTLWSQSRGISTLEPAP